MVPFLCILGFCVAGFYGCRAGQSSLDRLQRTQLLTEVVHITQNYVARHREDGRWPPAEHVVYSDLHPTGSRTNAAGERVDQFPSPFGGSEVLEFHLLDGGYIRVELH